MPSRELTLDPWSFFDFKKAFVATSENNGNAILTAPRWVGDHWRRLSAYMLLDSYYRNNGREWLWDIDEEDRDKRREYGDPALIVDTVHASLMGDSQVIVVDQADAEDDAAEQQEVLRTWADNERFYSKMFECERNAVKLGDGVYVLGWGEDRLKLHVYDPGFYFPVLDVRDVSGDYPETIHIAYEYEIEGGDRKKRRYVRRITWELEDTALDGPEIPAISYTHPWNDSPTTWTCFYSDATWLIDDDSRTVEDFTRERAVFAVEGGVVMDRVDLGIDFIPVVHVPNTMAGQEHYGTSTLAKVMQIFDDLVATDTDIQASAATTGSPPLAVSNASVPKDEKGRLLSYGPGTVLETGDGTATMIDTSRSLDALLKLDENLLERLAINGRVPESLMGRVKPSEVPSGITLTLSFTPHANLVEKEMRQVRKEKYGLLFKFVTRWFQGNGDIGFDTFQANMKFGTFLPADQQETQGMVNNLLNKENPSISLETAVQMLINAGFPIEDAVLEVQRIRQENFVQAAEMMDATGDVNAVRLRLGLAPLAQPVIEEEDEPALPT